MNLGRYHRLNVNIKYLPGLSRVMQGIHIGTSGWHYRHWRERFYPVELASSAWLTYYAREFDCVELNSSFYRLPAETTLREWVEQTNVAIPVGTPLRSMTCSGPTRSPFVSSTWAVFSRRRR